MIKSGTTAAGAKAASSHTGAIAGSDQAYTAAFKQSGIIRVHDVASLFNLALAFARQPLPAGPNLCIVTNSGGPGILAADACEKSGLVMSRLSHASVEELKTFLPPYASLYNPVDIIGDASAERYRKTLEVVARDERVHSIMVLLSPTASVEVENTAQAVIDLEARCDKPIFACIMGETVVRKGKRMLQDAGIPVYSFPEPAIASIDAMYRYADFKHRAAPVEVCVRRDLEKAAAVIKKTEDSGATEMVEFQAHDLLRAYDLPLPATRLCRTSDDAVAAADEIGYPVVLKIASPDISHKSDVGGVKLNLQNSSELRAAFLEVTSRAQRVRKDAYITGCLVQEMAPKGSKEIIVGFQRDPQFGPLVLFGLGGIYVEVLKDVAFRLAPLTLDDAGRMIREIKSLPLLRGVRGEPPVNFRAIEEVLLVMSQLALDFPQINEAEFNPVLVGEESAVVADVRVILTRGD
jgi:acetyltransferase